MNIIIYQVNTAKNIEELILVLAPASEDDEPFIKDDESLVGNNKLIEDEVLENYEELFNKKQRDKIRYLKK